MDLCEVYPMKIAIYTEDRYGPQFIKNIIHRLQDEGFIENIQFARTHTPSLIEKCHNVGNKIKSIIRDVDRVIIVIDKENIREYDENKEIWRHLRELKEKDKRKIFVVSNEPEIEEWICISKNLRFDESGINKENKPSKILERKIGYKKDRLPAYVNEIDIKKLMKRSKSFRKLVHSLSL